MITVCNLEHNSITFFCASHPERDVRGKWPPCERGLLDIRLNTFKLEVLD